MKPRLLTHNGKTMSVVDWARELNVTPKAMYTRLFANAPPEKLFLAAQAKRERDKHDLSDFQAAIKYDRETGQFFRGGKEVIPSLKNGRISDGAGHRACAMPLAWALATGEWPKGNVRPIDGNPLNLRFANLRLRDESRYGEDGKISARARHGYGLVQRYQIRRREYDAMFAAQGGVCACCGKPETQRGRTGHVKTLHVDHDHKTGEVRSLLCAHCNWMIGLADDDPDTLRLGIEYLAKYRRAKLTVVTQEE